MSRKTYNFEVIDENGDAVRRVTHRCNNMGAQVRAEQLLRKTPGAVAAFCCSSDGRAAHSAYRH